MVTSSQKTAANDVDTTFVGPKLRAPRTQVARRYTSDLTTQEQTYKTEVKLYHMFQVSM